MRKQGQSQEDACRGAPRGPDAPHLVPSGVVSSCPFAYKFVFDPKTLNTQPYFSEDVRGHRHRQTLVREDSAALPDTLPERGIVTGGIYTTMPASGVMRE